jgi:hypothetical protein
MKNIISILFFVVFTVQLHATTRTLNNAIQSPGQYTTFAAVHAASANDDTILVQGTGINYFTMSISKRLTIIGPGHRPVDKQNNQKAFCDNILLNTGSNRTTIIGLETSNVQAMNVGVDSVSIYLCRFLDALYFQAPNCKFWLVDGCVFTNTDWDVRAANQSVGNLTLRNNIFNGRLFQMAGTFIGYNYLFNNVFLCNDANTFNNINNFYISNNIFYRAGLGNANSTNLNFSNNCSYQCVGGSGNNFPNGTNFTNVDPMFTTSIGPGAFFSYNTDYNLQSTSPLINVGIDGTDLGVYGGSGDFDINGVPHNPYVKTISITGPTSINAGDSLQVFIKAKVRN